MAFENGYLLHSELFWQELLSFLAKFLSLLGLWEAGNLTFEAEGREGQSSNLEKANKPKNEARKFKKFAPEELTV